jgi:anti-sigma-K factor RskA
MTADRWGDMASAFVLGALDAEDREAFEARLEEDPRLRALVDEYRETLAALSEAVPQTEPPASLRARVLEKARESKPNAGRREEPGAPIDRATGTFRAAARTRPAAPAGTRWGPRLALAASILIALGLGGWAVELRQRAAELERQLAAASSQIEAIRIDLESAQVELARYDSLSAALIGTDLRFATLAAPDTEPRMHLVLNHDTDLVLVAAVNLPPAPTGRVYQLWGIRNGEAPVSLGVFDSGPDNVALQALAYPAGQDFDVSAVTEEPDGGSPQPTTDPFLVGGWTAGSL